MADYIRIVRYPNRKLYVEGTGYVSLDDLRRWTLERRHFAVFVHGCGEDLTAVHLARVVARMAERGDVPLWRLQQLIVAASDGA